MVNLSDFKNECVYKDEIYTVRDNGAVLRHSLNSKRKRPIDNKWTFGKLNIKSGYLELASVRVHRIVATAFHGEAPTKDHVVDHIDTNKQNNRSENLRWLTRLENIMLNPITIKRIESACGCNVEEFLDDPSRFRGVFNDSNYDWMCNVSAEEAQVCKMNLLTWASSNKALSGGSLGKWIFNRNSTQVYPESKQEITISLTPNSVQKNWKTPSEFQCCPTVNKTNSVKTYFSNLEQGKIFAKSKYSSSIIENFAISQSGDKFWVICIDSDKNAKKPYSLAEVTYEKYQFVHYSLGSFFQKVGAEKQFVLAQGLEWEGGETFDEFC